MSRIWHRESDQRETSPLPPPNGGDVRRPRAVEQQPAEVDDGTSARAEDGPILATSSTPLPASVRGFKTPARRRGVGWRTRNASAATVGAVGSGVLALARAVRLLAGLIALLIALAIVMRDVDANASNTIVEGIHEAANFFAGSFTGLITFAGHPKRAITIDWGIAAVAYLIVGALVAGFIARIGRGGLRFERRHRPPVASH
jgi:hypothetical protein